VQPPSVIDSRDKRRFVDSDAASGTPKKQPFSKCIHLQQCVSQDRELGCCSRALNCWTHHSELGGALKPGLKHARCSKEPDRTFWPDVGGEQRADEEYDSNGLKPRRYTSSVYPLEHLDLSISESLLATGLQQQVSTLRREQQPGHRSQSRRRTDSGARQPRKQAQQLHANKTATAI